MKILCDALKKDIVKLKKEFHDAEKKHMRQTKKKLFTTVKSPTNATILGRSLQSLVYTLKPRTLISLRDAALQTKKISSN